MIRSMHFARALERQVEILRRSGKKGEKAVDQYQTICHYLRLRGPEAVELRSKRTRNGELRIRNCIKYQLGHGYRLVTILIGDRLFLPFVGSHDEVDQWLDGRRREGFLPVESSYRCEQVTPPETALPTGTFGQDQEGLGLDAEDLEEPMPLGEEMLRVIFHGLCRNRTLP